MCILRHRRSNATRDTMKFTCFGARPISDRMDSTILRNESEKQWHSFAKSAARNRVLATPSATLIICGGGDGIRICGASRRLWTARGSMSAFALLASAPAASGKPPELLAHHVSRRSSTLLKKMTLLAALVGCVLASSCRNQQAPSANVWAEVNGTPIDR